MRDCLEQEGQLPANILYLNAIPEAVQSPLGPCSIKVEQAPPPPPKPLDQETLMQELAKKRELLLQLRQAARQEAKNKK